MKSVMAKNVPTASDANAALAFEFWLARCFRDGSPEEDLFRAVCANSVNQRSLKAKSELLRRSSTRKSEHRKMRTPAS